MQKISKTESDDIELKIDIIRKIIDKYNYHINNSNNVIDELHFLEKLHKEEKELEILKEKYPEYFI